MIRIYPDDARPIPSFSGLSAADDGWELDPSQYRDFTAAVTGITLTDDLRHRDCYRAGNRLEAFVAERRREGEWTPDLVERYPDVGSLDEIVALARFLRTCHDCCLDAAGEAART